MAWSFAPQAPHGHDDRMLLCIVSHSSPNHLYSLVLTLNIVCFFDSRLLAGPNEACPFPLVIVFIDCFLRPPGFVIGVPLLDVLCYFCSSRRLPIIFWDGSDCWCELYSKLGLSKLADAKHPLFVRNCWILLSFCELTESGLILPVRICCDDCYLVLVV